MSDPDIEHGNISDLSDNAVSNKTDGSPLPPEKTRHDRTESLGKIRCDEDTLCGIITFIILGIIVVAPYFLILIWAIISS